MYLASEWVIDTRQLANLRQLSYVTHSMEGEFSIVPDIYFHESKAFVDTILVIISKHGCGQLMKWVDELGFSSWREVESFDQELAFDPFQLSTFEQRTWEARLHMAHLHNLELHRSTGNPKTKNGPYDKPI